MNTHINIAIVILLAVGGNTAFASGSAKTDSDTLQTLPDTLTLRDCMEYAISNSTKIKIQQASNDDARLNRRDAIFSAFTPSISGQTYAYYNFGRAVDPQTNTYTSSTSFYDGYSVSGGIDLFNGFEAVNNLKIAKTSIALGNSEEEQTEAEICLATMEAYYNLLYYTELADIYARQVSTAKESLVKAKRQEELGQKGYADVVEMEYDLADKQYQYVSTVNKSKDARITLEDVMFWTEDTELVISRNIRTTDYSAGYSENPTSEEGIVDIARTVNPAVQIARLNVETARLELRTAKWQRMPTLSAYGGWSTTYYCYPGGDPTDKYWSQFKNNGGEYVELVISIPIFSGLKKHSTVAKKKNALIRASAEYDQKLRDVESEVRRAVQDRSGAEAELKLAQRKSDVQEEAYSLNLKKLDQGLISPIEFSTASENYLEAKAQCLNSLYTYLLKCSIVNYYGGISYIDQQY